jgi:hypothetical protein
MKDIKFNMEVECILTKQDIDDLMCTALEGGINYWCSEVIVLNATADKTLHKYASTLFSEGFDLELIDADDDTDKPESWILTLDKFISGVKQAMIMYGYTSIEGLMDNQDAEIADAIIQFALFNEIVFG